MMTGACPKRVERAFRAHRAIAITVAIALAWLASHQARAQTPSAAPQSSSASSPAGASVAPPTKAPRVTLDRVAVRFYAPETGGSSHPRYITERTLAFEARFEALNDESPITAAYEERYVRAAMERHVAEEILATLMVEQGTDPLNLPRQVDEWRQGLLQRIGGVDALRAAEQAEGIDDDELEAILRRRVRAAFYVDKSITPILHPSDEQLREVYLTSSHPFKAMKFDDARVPLLRWFVAERLRLAESAFLQAARTRVKIVVVTK